ncbi:Ribonuclease BN, tRNA processing enzyme [Salinibacillus kushneri]|uniref:Ribonuclease BN, tRNA processing enzyme n=1 Tax=Salinibacillus kushneri TaxID=237682 RepID=A0A1I0AZQ8_9BACI|nr:MBL fold metallo-hydrolase [Salinibacillus kushneri]SES99926.1 Ribonuclease BN, tRNA processing enzyme [Salinibacillus kushneri]
MKVKVIGFWGAYPEAEGATSSYLLEEDGYSLLVDCGSGALSRLQKDIEVTDLDALILSHYHHDHVADIGSLQYASLVQSYLREDTPVLPIYGHQANLDYFYTLTHKRTQGLPYDPDEVLNIGPFTITFLQTQHPVPCYAMRITNGHYTIVYTADTSYFDALIDFSKHADLLIAECSFYEGMDGSGPGHMTSDECGKLAQAAGVKQLWLTHLPHFGNIEQLKIEAGKYYSGRIDIAQEALTFHA